VPEVPRRSTVTPEFPTSPESNVPFPLASSKTIPEIEPLPLVYEPPPIALLPPPPPEDVLFYVAEPDAYPT
jgi:hypothetical protein